jgi:hypothetical protein
MRDCFEISHQNQIKQLQPSVSGGDGASFFGLGGGEILTARKVVETL